jgi:hypothetical protein
MPTWTRESVIAKLKENGLAFKVRDIAHGVQFRLPEDTPLDLYEGTGKPVIRGKENSERTLAQHIFENVTAL